MHSSAGQRQWPASAHRFENCRALEGIGAQNKPQVEAVHPAPGQAKVGSTQADRRGLWRPNSLRSAHGKPSGICWKNIENLINFGIKKKIRNLKNKNSKSYLFRKVTRIRPR